MGRPTVGSSEFGDEPVLLYGLYRVRVIVPPDVFDSLVGGPPVEDRDAGQRGAGAAAAAHAADLDPLALGPLPRVDERLPQCQGIGWQPVVGPLDPAELPPHPVRLPGHHG